MLGTDACRKFVPDASAGDMSIAAVSPLSQELPLAAGGPFLRLQQDSKPTGTCYAAACEITFRCTLPPFFASFLKGFKGQMGLTIDALSPILPRFPHSQQLSLFASMVSHDGTPTNRRQGGTLWRSPSLKAAVWPFPVGSMAKFSWLVHLGPG